MSKSSLDVFLWIIFVAFILLIVGLIINEAIEETKMHNESFGPSDENDKQ